MNGREYRPARDGDLTQLEDVVRKVTGLNFEIVIGMNSPISREYWFTIKE